MRTLIIFGSARADGDTSKVTRALAAELEATVVDLLDYHVAAYSYEGTYPEADNFISLLEEALAYDHLVLASPVYWYTMSAQLKTFLDRFTDLLTTHKYLGRQLRGKQLSVLSCANDGQVNDSFYDAFRLSAAYLDMRYGNEWHGWISDKGVEITLRATPTSPGSGA